MKHRAWQVALFVGLAIAALESCATRGQFPTTTTAAAPPAGPAEFSLFLIGDAGEPAKSAQVADRTSVAELAAKEPVLSALAVEVDRAPAAAVVFLGDNIYPAGLPAPTDPDRRMMEARLEAQIKAVPAKARVIFVPGNHDWESGDRNRLTEIEEQARLVQARGGGRADFAPQHGCPGPFVNDSLSPRLRLIALDTQWWLHKFAKGTSCAESTEDAVIAALDRALSSAGNRQIVLTSHHPMLSSGPHGGFYGWFDYRIFGRLIGDVQDLRSRKYSNLRTKVGTVMRKHPPLVYAAGHEHTQEVLRGDSARFFVVTGAGVFGHLSATHRRDETIFKHAASGFMRLDFLGDGGVWLTVLEASRDGTAAVAFSQRLQ